MDQADHTDQIMQTARGLRAHWLASITPHGRQAIHGISPRLVALLDELERRMDPARQRAASVTGGANPPASDWTPEQHREARRRFGLPPN
jgi:hypothetical protein